MSLHHSSVNRRVALVSINSPVELPSRFPYLVYDTLKIPLLSDCLCTV